MPRRRPHRHHPGYGAFLLHRLSGIALALFLPLHFLALATALTGEEALDGFLHWTDNPLVVVAEAGLVVLLAAHLAGGLRLLALEFLPWRADADSRRWRASQRALIGVVAGVSAAVGLLFLVIVAA